MSLCPERSYCRLPIRLGLLLNHLRRLAPLFVFGAFTLTPSSAPTRTPSLSLLLLHHLYSVTPPLPHRRLLVLEAQHLSHLCNLCMVSSIPHTMRPYTLSVFEQELSAHLLDVSAL